MRLRLCHDEVDFQLKITQWKKYREETWLFEWASVEFFLDIRYLHYQIPGNEIMLCSEVDALCKALGALLSGGMTENEHIKMAEPDLEFYLFPTQQSDSTSDSAFNCIRYGDEDIALQLIVHFWCGDGLSSNAFHMTFCRSEIEALYTYLQTVVGEIAHNDKRVCVLMEQGILLPK